MDFERFTEIPFIAGNYRRPEAVWDSLWPMTCTPIVVGNKCHLYYRGTSETELAGGYISLGKVTFDMDTFDFRSFTYNPNELISPILDGVDAPNPALGDTLSKQCFSYMFTGTWQQTASTTCTITVNAPKHYMPVGTSVNLQFASLTNTPPNGKDYLITGITANSPVFTVDVGGTPRTASGTVKIRAGNFQDFSGVLVKKGGVDTVYLLCTIVGNPNGNTDTSPNGTRLGVFSTNSTSDFTTFAFEGEAKFAAGGKFGVNVGGLWAYNGKIYMLVTDSTANPKGSGKRVAWATIAEPTKWTMCTAAAFPPENTEGHPDSHNYIVGRAFTYGNYVYATLPGMPRMPKDYIVVAKWVSNGTNTVTIDMGRSNPFTTNVEISFSGTNAPLSGTYAISNVTASGFTITTPAPVLAGSGSATVQLVNGNKIDWPEGLILYRARLDSDFNNTGVWEKHPRKVMQHRGPVEGGNWQLTPPCGLNNEMLFTRGKFAAFYQTWATVGYDQIDTDSMNVLKYASYHGTFTGFSNKHMYVSTCKEFEDDLTDGPWPTVDPLAPGSWTLRHIESRYYVSVPSKAANTPLSFSTTPMAWGLEKDRGYYTFETLDPSTSAVRYLRVNNVTTTSQTKNKPGLPIVIGNHDTKFSYIETINGVNAATEIDVELNSELISYRTGTGNNIIIESPGFITPARYYFEFDTFIDKTKTATYKFDTSGKFGSHYATTAANSTTCTINSTDFTNLARSDGGTTGLKVKYYNPVAVTGLAGVRAHSHWQINIIKKINANNYIVSIHNRGSSLVMATRDYRLSPPQPISPATTVSPSQYGVIQTPYLGQTDAWFIMSRV